MGRDITRFPDQTDQVLPPGAGGIDPGRLQHFIFQKGPSHVIGAEGQSNLPELDPLREPARLDIFEIIEKETADGQCSQIIVTARRQEMAHPGSAVRGKGPANESPETVGFVL